MNIFRFADRRIPLLSLITMLTLLGMSMVFWRERGWLLDVAFQTFLMVKDGTVQVMVYRFGAATVQSLPLLGIKLGAPLAVVSWLYSVSFHLHFLAFFAACAYGFKREDVALGVVLLYTAMVCHGFFWQTSELQQGLGFLLVSWAALLRFPLLSTIKSWLLWSLALTALAFYHPLIFLPFYVMFVWLWFKPSAGVPRPTLIKLGLLMIAVLIVKQIWFQNWYDTAKTAQFVEHFKTYFPNFFTFPAYRRFLENVFVYWWGYPLVFGLVNALLIRKKRWFGLGFLWCVTLGFMVLTAIGDPDTVHRFYAEVNYYPLLVFALVPFILNLGFLREETSKYQALLVKSKAGQMVRRYAFWLLLVFFAARLFLIIITGNQYRARVDYLRQLTSTALTQKHLIDPDSLDKHLIPMDWGLPYESLLQSAAETKRPVTLLPFTPAQIEEKQVQLNTDTLFVTPWDAFPYRDVNANPYWNLPEESY